MYKEQHSTPVALPLPPGHGLQQPITKSAAAVTDKSPQAAGGLCVLCAKERGPQPKVGHLGVGRLSQQA
jgi:hypothetical protein